MPFSFRKFWIRLYRTVRHRAQTTTLAQSNSGTYRITMDLPFDIVDHIFSFLKSNPKALFACSEAHPVLSLIVERYLFRHISICTGTRNFRYSFKPSELRSRLAETPRIAKYVVVLQIELDRYQAWVMRALEEIASLRLLSMFPVLECIMLSTHSDHPWEENLPKRFRTALESCFRLPTLQEVHVGNLSFPLSMLDNHANINHLSLSAPPEIEPESQKTTWPQIKSLSIQEFDGRRCLDFHTWAKQHIRDLRSLSYDFSCHSIISEVLKIGSNTLENLDVSIYREGPPVRLINISSLHHLRYLTIRVETFLEVRSDDNVCHSFLGRALQILKTAPSRLQQLTIEIYVDLREGDYMKYIDLSPLKVLAEPSVCFHHIDFYIYTGLPYCPFTHTIIGSLLAKVENEGLLKLIEQGVLVVHPEEIAPTFSSRYCLPREKQGCIIM